MTLEDWRTVLETLICTLEDGKAVIEAIFYIVTGSVVVMSLRAWKSELRGRARYEAARNVIAGAYRVRDAIRACQSGFMTPEEWASRQITKDENEGERRCNDTYFAYRRRFDHVISEVREWYPSIVEAEALFGPEARGVVEKVEAAARKLRAAIEIHCRSMLKPQSDMTSLVQQNIVFGISPALADSDGDRNDPTYDDGGFQKDLEEAVNRVRNYFMPHIR